MRAVCFDLDGTLVELPADFESVFETALSDAGVSVDPDYHEYYTEVFFEYLDECHPEPTRAAMADLCEEFNFVADFDALASAYVDREVAGTDLRPGAREALDALDCPTGVLTNGSERVQRRKLSRYDLADRLNAVVVSGDVGAAKPDPEIFAAARDELSAEEYAFVADDLERDVLPAQAAGFTGIYLAEDPDDGADRADAVVESLREVPEVLDRV